ncbi:MAG: PadR family transcriptional regulator [Desulfomonilia bacterium]|jgi:DNA-binding PadR family transcriptional regulator
MDTDQIILGFLMSGPKSGYKIKNITGRLMMAYNLSLNQIYPALRKLEAADLVRKEVVIQTGKPNKHVYSITEKGRQEFLRSLVSPPIPVDYQLDFLTRAFFFRFLTHEQVIEQFEKEIGSLEEQLEDLEHMRDNALKHGDENGQFIYRVIVGMIEMLRDTYTRELERRRSK